MKKIISLFTIAAIALSTAACGGKAGNSNAGSVGVSAGGNTGNGQEQPTRAPVSLEDISGEITVSAYEAATYKAYLEEAAVAFEAKYPGTKVNVSTFSAMPEVKTSESGGKKIQLMTMEKDPQAEQDYISKVSTELMGGGGADILAMDILPFYKYAESGQLEDLGLYMEADPAFHREDYRENILDALVYQGGQYVFPMDYSFSYFAYDNTLFDPEQQKPLQGPDAFTYEELIEAGQAPFAAANEGNPEPPIQMFGFNAQSFFNSVLQADYDKFVDVEAKEAHFDDGAFVELLESAKAYAEKGYISQGNMNQKMQITPDMFEQNKAPQYLYKTNISIGLLQLFNKNSNMRIMYGGTSGSSENDEIAGLITNDNGEKAFTYSQAYGISANSANKATAWAFLRFLAEEQQDSLQIRGLPLNKKALAERTKQSITGQLYEPGQNSGTGELTPEQEEIYEDYMVVVENMSDQINKYFIRDAIISDAINSEVRYFFDGSGTAQDVANKLQNKIELYLNE